MDRFTTKEDLKAELVSCIYCPEYSNCFSNMSCNEIYNALSKLRYYENLEEQGRLIVLSVEDVHPCRNCGIGWGYVSSEGCHTCDETCERLKQYNQKYRT